MHRVRVGMTGLATVVVLIGLASALFSAAKDSPMTTAGAPNAQVIANMTGDTSVNLESEKGAEPLAQLGVTPSASGSEGAEIKTLEQKPADPAH